MGRLGWLITATLVAACGGGTTTTDAGPVDGGTSDLGAPAADGGTDGGSPDAGCTTDGDGDGHRSIACGGDDCDDSDPTAYPGHTEVCDDHGHDEDCNPSTVGPDADGDGIPSTACCDTQPGGMLVCGTDCDDTTPDVSPLAPEVCDGVDDDCDGMIDEDVRTTFFHDLDGDGFGDATMTRLGCSAPSGYVLVAGDCNDASASVHPGATEACNAIDDDCDGVTDPGCACTTGTTRACGAVDASGMLLTAGICRTGTQTCAGAAWGDCTGSVPPESETCNGVDDDCDGVVDDGVTMLCYADADGDGFAIASATSTAACSCATGTTSRAPTGATNVDCDDTMTAVHPGAPELCNGRDDNCNGMIDETTAMMYWRDADGDGYGARGSTPMTGCSMPMGYVANSLDCNDAVATVHPGAVERCDGVDQDCDGVADPMDADSTAWCIARPNTTHGTFPACDTVTPTWMCDYVNCIGFSGISGPRYANCNSPGPFTGVADDDGCETRLGTDSQCNGCTDVCATGMSRGCFAGSTYQCGCHRGYGDCDGNPSNGCEVTFTGVSGGSCSVCSASCGTNWACWWDVGEARVICHT